ncbi:MAG TPA: 2-amino-4-hydroxy-6-hydroxymethyldihydropteridine diphosphokinase [Bdellovibrionota bacterium]|nr:2-amino-4-hydroxy-6-hydroxymethyldihydropteridine diphosphokinase [Bdellovibrionota bacterium]
MAIVYISIGSNLGDREKYCQRAIEKVGQLPTTKLLKISSLIETDPVGKTDQPQFINGVIKIETKLSPHELLENLQKIENDLGRVRDEKWGPRTIDLDILYYDDLKVKEKNLTLPHPEINNRPFIAKVLAEIMG